MLESRNCGVGSIFNCQTYVGFSAKFESVKVLGADAIWVSGLMGFE
jgi:hypothetical protein